MQLPKRVTLELTNHCNRSCEGCPRHKMRYPQGDMNIGLLTDIVEQLPPETIVVPFFRGESLLHPRFADAMEKLRKFQTVQLATNGDYLTPKNQKAITSACSFASLSLHSLQNPHSFLPSAKNEGVTTQVSIVDSLLPDDKKQEFADGWLQYVDRVRIYREHSHNGFGDIVDGGEDVGWPCMKPMREMVVYWDGEVALCNHDWNGPQLLGNLRNQSVYDVWNGVQYKLIRELHSEGDRRAVEACKDCDYWVVSYLPDKMFGELYIN